MRIQSGPNTLQKYLPISYKVKHAHLTKKFYSYSPKKSENIGYKKTCVRMLITALFKIDKNWKQSKCSSTGE